MREVFVRQKAWVEDTSKRKLKRFFHFKVLHIRFYLNNTGLDRFKIWKQDSQTWCGQTSFPCIFSSRGVGLKRANYKTEQLTKMLQTFLVDTNTHYILLVVTKIHGYSFLKVRLVSSEHVMQINIMVNFSEGSWQYHILCITTVRWLTKSTHLYRGNFCKISA